MSGQETELVVTLLGAGLALVFVSKFNKGRKKGDLRNYYMGKGQFLDPNSHAGTLRTFMLGLLVCFVGWYLDEIGRWIWHQFGNELIVSPAKERWHRIISTTIGLVLVIASFLQLIFLSRDRNRKSKEAEITQLRRFHDL